jgi:hypothetical protein
LESEPCNHPFILWNREDIADLRRRLENDPWTKAAWDKWMAADASENRSPYTPTLRNFARWAILEDREAAEKEKKELLRVLNSPVPRGGAQWITVLRYDLLYDDLTVDQHKAFEKMARIYIENAIFAGGVFNPKIFNDSADYSRYDAKRYTRTNWLPNIIWPRKVSANLMAAATRDEALIRKTSASYGSWKWYFDEYLCDTGLYSEEFSKMASTPGAMLLYCRAVERLGLDELGFGHRGRRGATMRGTSRAWCIWAILASTFAARGPSTQWSLSAISARADRARAKTSLHPPSSTHSSWGIYPTAPAATFGGGPTAPGEA